MFLLLHFTICVSPLLENGVILKTFDKIHFQLGGSHVAKESDPHQPKKKEAHEIKSRTLNLKNHLVARLFCRTLVEGCRSRSQSQRQRMIWLNQWICRSNSLILSCNRMEPWKATTYYRSGDVIVMHKVILEDPNEEDRLWARQNLNLPCSPSLNTVTTVWTKTFSFSSPPLCIYAH